MRARDVGEDVRDVNVHGCNDQKAELVILVMVKRIVFRFSRVNVVLISFGAWLYEADEKTRLTAIPEKSSSWRGRLDSIAKPNLDLQL